MHRLSRQVLCPRSLSRVVRAQRTSGSARNPSVVPRRHYAASVPAVDRFERLLVSLRTKTKMREDELAITIAALHSASATNQAKRDLLNRTITTVVDRPGVDKKVLYEKVNYHLANPPADNYSTLVENFTEHSKAATSSSASAHIQTPWEELPDDPSIIHPFDQIIEHLQRPEIRRTLEILPGNERQNIMDHVQAIARNPDEKEPLMQMADLLAVHHVPIQYRRRVTPPMVETAMPDEVDEYLAQARLEDEELNQELLAEEAKLEVEEAKEEAAVQEKAESEMSKAPPPSPYPNLMVSDPLLDSRDVLELPPDKDTPFHNRVIVRNHSSIFNEALAEDGFDFGADDYVPTKTDETEESASSLENLPFTPSELSNFYRFPLIHKRITQQTGKGKIHRQFVLMVVGNGDGMVGLGQGKDDDASRAEAKAYAQAVRNMDWVERFEKRTIWTDMEAKLGATQILLRPRPVGFGLRCNPNLHQVLKAAGIKDISAKVWGSRNPINVIKAAFRMLQAGHAPLAMGDGIGGKARKLNKGSGLRSKSEVERERGRQLISLRK